MVLHLVFKVSLFTIPHHRPVLYFAYYVILLVWVFLFPNLFSFGLVIWIIIDILLTFTSDHYLTRSLVMQSMDVSSMETGVLDSLFESLYERCVLLPSQKVRRFTLFYCLLLQIHGFIGSTGITHEVESRRWLFYLFGGHVTNVAMRDRYIQLLLFAALYAIYRVGKGCECDIVL